MGALAFELPPRLEAHAPPEARGVARDDVRLLVASRDDGAPRHARFRELPELLEPGDLLVVNTSATLPAALPARRADGTQLELRLSTPAPDRDGDAWWIVELRDGDDPFRGARLAGERSRSPAAARRSSSPRSPRAPACGWPASGCPGRSSLPRRARPPDPLPLRARRVAAGHYQNAYAREPGSAEMASAGRPFTAELVTALVARGVYIAPITLHTGVSSPESHEPSNT